MVRWAVTGVVVAILVLLHQDGPDQPANAGPHWEDVIGVYWFTSLPGVGEFSAGAPPERCNGPTPQARPGSIRAVLGKRGRS